ncbi:MAG: glycosyltransferase family 39 protein [Anaerolineae bacterium]|nr:glycosyltransferase family 39 protein [Anaerolineae bacterium]
MNTHTATWTRLALLAILLLAFALRVYRLDAQALWWDESLSLYRSTRDLGTVLANTILIQNIPTTDTIPQGYFLLLNLLVRAWGTSEFALRFFSVLVNVATLPLLYALARRWTNPTIASLAMLLGALSPFYVWYAQEARPYALVLFWSTLAVYALVRAFAVASVQCSVFSFQFSRITSHASRITSHASRFTLFVIIYILASIAALFTHYLALFLLPFHALAILILVWQTRARRWWCLLPAIPGASVVLLLPQIVASMAWNVDKGPVFVPLDVILRDLLNSFTVGITLDWETAVWFDVAMLAVLILGISALPRQWQLIVGAYLLVPVLSVFAFSFYRPIYQNSRYLIAISPAFYVGVAAGIATLARYRRALGALALGVFVLGAMLSLNNWFFDARYGKDDHRGWAESLRERVRADDFLILNSPHTEELYRYYADDLVPMMTLPILRADRQLSPNLDRAYVRAALQNHARVWYLGLHVPFDDPDARIERYLNEEGVLLDHARFAGTSTEIVLMLFVRALPTVDAVEIPNPLNVLFDGHLRLRGYAAPSRGTLGESVSVKLYWQVDEPVGEDYAVSLRLVDATDARVGQWDAIPLGNRAGSSTWTPHQIIVDERAVVLPRAPGVYRWQVVPYHSATGNALGDGVTLGEIQIH